MNNDLIKELCFRKKMTIPQLAQKIGMSKSFYTTLKSGSIKVETLEKIAEVLDVPVTVFFNEETANWNNKDLIDENVRLSIKNEEKENKITELQVFIESLNKLIKNQSALIKHYENLHSKNEKEKQ